MWQRFTERARHVVFFAQEEAIRFGANHVCTEHLLLGLLRDGDSVACRALERMGFSLEGIRQELEPQIPHGDGQLTQDMQLTPRAKRVIDLAYDEKRHLNNNYIGTEHLLLGLIREGEGLAGRVLAKLGVDLERTRHEVQALQERDTGTSTASTQVELSTPSSVLSIQVTPAVSRALLLAQEVATKAQRPSVELEDVLLGLLQLGEGKVAKVFEQFGMDSAKVQAVLQRLQQEEPPQGEGDAPAT